MKIVKFDNGKYGVRLHWFFGWCFYNFWSKNCVERAGSAHFHMAQTNDKDLAINEYNKLTGKTAKYKVIELNE